MGVLPVTTSLNARREKERMAVAPRRTLPVPVPNWESMALGRMYKRRDVTRIFTGLLVHMLWMNTTWPGTAATRHTSPSTATRGERRRRRKQLALSVMRQKTKRPPLPPLTGRVLVCLVVEMSHRFSNLVKPDGEQRERSDGERRSKKQPRGLGNEHLIGLRQQEHARCSGHLIKPPNREDKMTKKNITPCTATTLTSTARSSRTGRGLLVIARRYTSPQQMLHRNGSTGLSLAIFGRSQGTPYTRATILLHTRTCTNTYTH